MTYSTSPTSVRPTSVTIAVVIGWISVLLDLFGGVSLFALAGNDRVVNAMGEGSGSIQVWAIAQIVLGLVLALVVSMLARGSNLARFLVSLVMAIRIVAATWVLFAVGTHQLGESIVTIVIAGVALFLLWNASARDWFASR